MTHDLLTIQLRSEQDVVSTRQRAREIGALLGLKTQDQTSLATAVSELTRHAHRMGPGALAAFSLRVDPEPALVVQVVDSGAAGATYVEGSIGLITARKLVDEFDSQPIPGRAGTTVTIAKRLPRRATLTPEAIRSITSEVARQVPRDPMSEVEQQNRELMQAFDELQKRQAEVERLNAELAETNRGVLALYAELDEKAETLRRASELKSRFLSDMTHELRTPLNAMISLSQLLLDRADGDLTSEQERQVGLIRRSATSLNEMVSDLLDIARIEAGKEDVRAASFPLSDVLSAMRGMFRPLTPPRVKLHIEDSCDKEQLTTDERKLTQILRNLLSNAIKFTQAGEVKLTLDCTNEETISFHVSDTGIGIGPNDLSRIFDDYAKVDGPLQRSLRGTGLGLPLTRKLARLLGGDVTFQSEPGRGSTFSVTLPRRISGSEPAMTKAAASAVATLEGEPRA